MYYNHVNTFFIFTNDFLQLEFHGTLPLFSQDFYATGYCIVKSTDIFLLTEKTNIVHTDTILSANDDDSILSVDVFIL